MNRLRHSVLDLIRLSTTYLAQRGVETPRLDAEVLLAYVLDLDRMGIYVNFDRPLETHEVDLYRESIRRRGQREPVAYIVGEKEFMEQPFAVSPAVLIPRPETELLVEMVITRLQQATSVSDLSLLDVGTGSGVIAVMLALNFAQAKITACDISVEALAVARKNAQRHDVATRIEFVAGDLLVTIPDEARYHCIVSNPPYISEAELATLAPELRYEPRNALAGGADGLLIIRRLLQQAHRRLLPGGHLAMEIGTNQAQSVRSLAAECGYECIEIVKDYADHERFVFARKVKM